MEILDEWVAFLNLVCISLCYRTGYASNVFPFRDESTEQTESLFHRETTKLVTRSLACFSVTRYLIVIPHFLVFQLLRSLLRGACTISRGHILLLFYRISLFIPSISRRSQKNHCLATRVDTIRGRSNGEPSLL